MMYIFIASIILLCIILMYQYISFTRFYYFNSSLNQFKELRHKSTLFITAKMDTTPLSEIQEHREFLNSVNSIVQKFDTVKYDISRFELVKAIYRQIIFSSDSFEHIKYEHSESLHDFKLDYVNSLHELFKAIPFFRTRLIVHFVRLLLSILVQIGIIKFKRNLLAIDKLIHAQENLSDGCFN